MKDKIDQLMISRSQGQQPPNNTQHTQTQEERHQELQNQGRTLEDREEEEYGEYSTDQYEEVGRAAGQKFTECDEYVDPSTSQNQNQNHESSECSFQAASPSTQRSSTNYFSQDMTGRISSYSTRPTFVSSTRCYQQ